MPTASPMPAPTTREQFTRLMVRHSADNATLLAHLYPTGTPSADVNVNWVPFTQGCERRYDCYCHHVKGDMSKSINPEGWKLCYPDNSGTLSQCAEHRHRNCACLSGGSCLFSDMRPTKLLAAITAARAAGVSRIVEEGRFGGLSALEYALHGFEVDSVEFLPLDGPSATLKRKRQERIEPLYDRFNDPNAWRLSKRRG